MTGLAYSYNEITNVSTITMDKTSKTTHFSISLHSSTNVYEKDSPVDGDSKLYHVKICTAVS